LLIEISPYLMFFIGRATLPLQTILTYNFHYCNLFIKKEGTEVPSF